MNTDSTKGTAKSLEGKLAHKLMSARRKHSRATLDTYMLLAMTNSKVNEQAPIKERSLISLKEWETRKGFKTINFAKVATPIAGYAKDGTPIFKG